MAKYTGDECIVCKQKFKDNDDIVVCPECGTPYHRECYKQTGECINSTLHDKHESWVSSQPNRLEKIDKSPDNSNAKTTICPRCGHSNVDGRATCEKCNFHLPHTNRQNINGLIIDFNDPYCGMNPKENFDGVTLSEISAYVGKNRYYYLPLFKRMKDTGKKITFNLTALFFPQLYLSNRKMYLFAFFSIAIWLFFTLTSVFGSLVENSAGITSSLAEVYDISMLIESPLFVALADTLHDISTFLNSYDGIIKFLYPAFYLFHYVSKFIFGTFGNWLYYKKAVYVIKKTRAKKLPIEEHYRILKEKGGKSILSLLLFIGIQFILYSGTSVLVVMTALFIDTK